MVYPQTRVQLCMVQRVEELGYVSHKHMKEVATDLKAIYSASTEAEAAFNLELFAEKWDQHYPNISKAWRARLPPCDPLVCLPRGYSQSHLHHQCHPVDEHDLAQGDAQSSHLSL
jgi:putative transposase